MIYLDFRTSQVYLKILRTNRYRFNYSKMYHIVVQVNYMIHFRIIDHGGRIAVDCIYIEEKSTQIKFKI